MPHVGFFREFEDIAIAIADRAFNIDVEKALLLVEQPHPNWGNYNCLCLAAFATDRVHAI